MLVQNKLKGDKKLTNAQTGTPFDREIPTTLPTPLVAQATKLMLDVSLSQVQKLRKTHERITLNQQTLET